jgi:hypothetical protein
LHALQHCRAREILALEPEARLRIAPEKIFVQRNFRRDGVAFMRGGQTRSRPGVWKVCGLVPPQRAVGTTAFVADRVRCWPAFSLWRWIVDRNYFFTGYVDGDGGAAQLALAKLGQPSPVSAFLSRNVFRASNGVQLATRNSKFETSARS